MQHRENIKIISDKKVTIDRLYLTAIRLAGIKISDKNMNVAIRLLSDFGVPIPQRTACFGALP